MVRSLKDRARSVQQPGSYHIAALWQEHSTRGCAVYGPVGRLSHHYFVYCICRLWLVCAHGLAGDNLGICDLPGTLQPWYCLGASGLRAQNGLELWTSDQAPAQPDLLLASVDDVSEFSLGHDRSQPVTVMGVDSPALEWALRDRTVEFVSTLDPQVAPPIVITPLMSDLGLPAAYRGQDFTWRQRPLWEQIQNTDWIRWLVFRQLPRENETIVLWVRDDLFPDAREALQQP